MSYTVISFSLRVKVSTPHKQCLLNLTGDHNDNGNDVVTLLTEDIHQEITVRTEVRHEPDNVIQTSPPTVRVRRTEFTRLTPAQVRTQTQTALPCSE